MTKGTYSQGKRATKSQTVYCRRCGKKSFHVRKKACSSCGFGKSTKMRSYVWAKK